ncbi:hypothetical protein VC83_04045 [Pseudogymnoascus destructans]|uniref:Uncharacterized protein n=1 Tax=Pseudogymnoascus destructans TaxID=655981 RepID=A0A177AF17_9PEZI|nr:uncharacterized protein VC83_04045 [Pseudogymnoascus destructans]OAF59754.1 hypothetical protein VC83_04045 [Pseudogymnoascus destructans]
MAPKPKGKALVATPRKRPAAQMSGSPESQAPATPVPSGVASPTSRSRTVRPYRSPEVEGEAEELEGSVVPESEAPKGERTVLGWKVAARCEVPDSAGRLRAGSRPCCVKCAHTYYNFPGQMCWVPSGMAKCADCLRGNHACVPAAAKPAEDKGVAGPPKEKEIAGLSEVVARNADDPRQALLHHAESLVELGKAKTEGLKAATQVFHASVDKVLDAYQSGLEEYVNTMKFLVEPRT